VINVIDKELERHEIEALLPWHAAGTLSRREADLVEPALADDSELARLYDLVLQELAETHLNETLGAPSARSWRSCSPQSTLRGGACATPPASAQPNAFTGEDPHLEQ
jgi:hypothetical protein